jgi:Na+/phosphate symporter
MLKEVWFHPTAKRLGYFASQNHYGEQKEMGIMKKTLGDNQKEMGIMKKTLGDNQKEIGIMKKTIGDNQKEMGVLKDIVFESQETLKAMEKNEKNHRKIASRLAKKSQEIVQYKETIDDYRNELKKTQSDAANKEKNNQILVVIGDLVGKIYHNIYYILKCDKNTPLTFRLPVEVDMCIFLKRAFTDYEENLKFALHQLNISYSDYYILVKSKRDRNNIMHSSMPVSDLYNILDESTFTDYEEIITTLNKYKLVIVSMDT